MEMIVLLEYTSVCCIRVFQAELCKIHALVSVIQAIHLSEHLYHCEKIGVNQVFMVIAIISLHSITTDW